MPRVVIEREVILHAGEPPGPAQARIDAAAQWVAGRMRELARARPPYLVEVGLTVTDHGGRRHTARAVMNTDRGDRLHLK